MARAARAMEVRSSGAVVRELGLVGSSSSVHDAGALLCHGRDDSDRSDAESAWLRKRAPHSRFTRAERHAIKKNVRGAWCSRCTGT